MINWVICFFKDKLEKSKFEILNTQLGVNMIEPPIDKLIEKVGGKFALVCLVYKRANNLLEKQDNFEGIDEPVLTHVSNEVFNGRVEIARDDRF